MALECSDGEERLEESVASERLGRKVEVMLDAVDTTLNDLERDFVSQENGLNVLGKHKQELVRLRYTPVISYNRGKFVIECVVMTGTHV